LTSKKNKPRKITLKKRGVRTLSVDELADADGGKRKSGDSDCNLCNSVGHQGGVNHNQALRARPSGRLV
jgi:hypothetical protein